MVVTRGQGGGREFAILVLQAEKVLETCFTTMWIDFTLLNYTLEDENFICVFTTILFLKALQLQCPIHGGNNKY